VIFVHCLGLDVLKLALLYCVDLSLYLVALVGMSLQVSLLLYCLFHF